MTAMWQLQYSMFSFDALRGPFCNGSLGVYPGSQPPNRLWPLSTDRLLHGVVCTAAVLVPDAFWDSLLPLETVSSRLIANDLPAQQ